MNKFSFRVICAAVSVLLMLAFPVCSFAVSTDDAAEPLDYGRSGSLTLTYKVGEKRISGLEIEIFEVASFNADLSFTLTDKFASYPLNLRDISSDSEWTSAVTTISSYVIADSIKADRTEITDENGVVKYEDLNLGIYYVRWTNNETAEKVEGFNPFMIFVPSVNDDGKFVYDIDSFPKPGKINVDTVSYKVIKVWKGDADKTKRTDAVKIGIYKNGELYKTVDLNAACNWNYEWTDEDDGAKWTVVERDVPDGFTVQVTENEGYFVVTNTYESETSSVNPPSTGDTSSMNIIFAVMFASGFIIVVIAIGTRSRRSYEA